jgi:DNA mismatch repair protein MutS2
MNSSSMEMLEFPKIREILAGFTSFSASRELAISLQPSSSPATVALMLKQSAEALRLISLRPGFSIGSAHDVRDMAQTSAKGKTLEPDTFLEIRETLAASRVLHRNLQKMSEQVPALWVIAANITEFADLENRINQCITATGEIADSASLKLGEIRHRLKASRQQLFERLDTLLKSKNRQKFIQEQFVTEREGRYVIPVKADFRKDFKGIIHDMSNTGSTVFIEPWETVELGNDLRQLVLEEKQEIDRILADLSAQVGAQEENICNNVAIIAELDLILAKARYGEKIDANVPVITTQNSPAEKGDGETTRIVHLAGARHPLLKGTAVPLTIEIGFDFSVLVITGPNTGGKTVALKTIGLLALMAQAGIPIPALDGSSLPVFDGIFADIGDQQSIEQTLSTFSWHIGNIVQILRNSTSNSLVLLDELGISTDPNEGSALAKAILQHLLEKGTMTIATTHYSDLKAYAHTTRGIRNASLDFDPVSLTPTYHLTVGIPGRSNALSMASHLGLDPGIIAAARSMMSTDSQQFDALLDELDIEKQKYETLLHGLEKEQSALENFRKQLEQEGQRLREQEKKVIQEEGDKLINEAAALLKLIRDTESELRKTRKKEQVDRARKALDTVHKQMNTDTWQAKLNRQDKAPDASADSITPGDRVRLVDKDLEGNVISVDADSRYIEIQVGNTRLRAKMENIEKISAQSGEVLAKFPAVRKILSRKPVSLELDLRGKRADEVPIILDSYINDAFLGNLGQVRIIHGYATGTVRQIVRETLPTHPLVKSFRPGGKEDGGDGVTIVLL